MFSKVALFVATFALAAVAAPGGYPVSGGSTTVNQCNVGEVQCCNQVQSSDSKEIQSLLGLLNIAVGSITGQVGVNCTPISVIGLGGNSCNAQPVCCTKNNFNGLVNLGCSPINLNL